MSVNYNPPFMYPEVNLIDSSFQDMSEYYNSEVYWFWWRNLYEMLLSEFDVECEDTWNKGLLMYCILGNGYIGVFDTDIDYNPTSSCIVVKIGWDTDYTYSFASDFIKKCTFTNIWSSNNCN